jgi:DNA-directed RNA polymerase omega subunit
MAKNALLGKALKRAQNRYLLVNILAKRVRQLKDGAKPLVEAENDLSVEEVALLEIAEGKIAGGRVAS